MMIDALLLAAFLVGHVCLLILLLNWLHGLGYSGRWLAVVAYSLLGLCVLSGPYFLWAFGGRPWSDWWLPARLYSLVCIAVALIGLPLSTLKIQFRPLPRGISRKSVEKDLSENGSRESLIGNGRLAWMLRLPINDQFRLQIHNLNVSRPGLPDVLDGLRILQLSDLHFAPAYDRRFFERVIDAIAEVESDLVLFTGDLVDDESCLDWARPVLGRLTGRLGKFAVLGNHDEALDPRRSAQALEAAGFTLLDGRWQLLTIEDTSLALGGTCYPWGPLPPPEDRPDASATFILSHSPDTFGLMTRWGVDLVLSGHTHGGQYRLPLIGPILMPSRFGRRYDRGFFGRGKTLMYVSQGVGAKHPLRVGCPPEVAVFTLRSNGATGTEGASHFRDTLAATSDPRTS